MNSYISFDIKLIIFKNRNIEITINRKDVAIFVNDKQEISKAI